VSDDLSDDLLFLSSYSSDDEWDVRRAERIRQALQDRGITAAQVRGAIHEARQRWRDGDPHVVAWLHLNDREEMGDFYLREVWKTVALEPAGNPEYTKSVPVLESEARRLLGRSDAELQTELYEKLGVTSLDPLPGLPKGPYYDPVDVGSIRAALERALTNLSHARDRLTTDDAIDQLRIAPESYIVGTREADLGKGDLSEKRIHVLALNGQIVDAVRRELQHDDSALEKLSPLDFEYLVAEILRDMGLDVAPTRASADGGRDILAYVRVGPVQLMVIVECKKWARRRRVGVQVVKQLLSTLRDQDHANAAFLVTTAYYTRCAEALALDKMQRWPLRLFDHDDLIRWLSRYGTWEEDRRGGLWLPHDRPDRRLK
jgi:hypothetical protein